VTPRLRRILISVGYGSAYSFLLLLFFYLTFPYDRLKDRIVRDFNARQTGPDPMRLEIDEIDSYWLSGVEAEGVRLVSKAEAPRDAKDKKAKDKVTGIEHAHARLSILSLLIGRRSVSFGADAFGGAVEGTIVDSDAERNVEIEIEALDLGQTPLLAGLLGLPVSGALSGTIELVAPEARLSKANGKIALKVTGVSVGDGKAKIRDLIALPKLDAGELTIAADAKAGQVKVTEISARGPDLELSADGGIRLRDQADQSYLNLTTEFKFTDRYTNKDDLTRALFGKSGAFDLDPKNRRAKRSDGFYSWRITGSLSKPLFAPNPMAPPKKGKGSEPRSP
jgi:type II secretion system protein N